MNRIGLIRLLVAGAALSVLPHEASACGNMPYGIDDPMTLRLIAEEQIHVADPSHNVGVYHWDESLQRHVLVASYFDADLLFSPPEPQPGDVVEYIGDDDNERLSNCQPPTLPPVTVTTSLPSRAFLGRAFVRVLSFGGLGGRARVTSSLGAPVPDNPANDETATCLSDVGSRQMHAHKDVAPYAAARWLAGRPIGRGELVRVTYDDGGTELWRAVGGPPTSTAWSIHPVPVSGSLKCP
ncbi:MAG: hypothetical protein ACK4JC_08870 [Silanimonas lenta]